MSNNKSSGGLFGNTSDNPVTGKEILETTKKRATPKDLPDTGASGNVLYIPRALEERMHEEGYTLAWVRIYIGNGELDVKSIRQKEGEGYTFVTRDEAPEMGTAMSSFFGEEVDKHGELIAVGDVALAKIPTDLLRRIRRQERSITDNRSRALRDDLQKHRIGDPTRGDVYETKIERPSKTRNVDFGD